VPFTINNHWLLSSLPKRKVDCLQRFVEITHVKVVLVSMASRINIYSFIQISEIVIINTQKRIYDI